MDVELTATLQGAKKEKWQSFLAHAGLEPAVLGEKNPDMEMVCIGPQLYYLHSITEAADLNSLPGFARLLATVLAELAK